VSQDPQRPSHRDAVAETARWTAAARAQESEREDRLFDDPLARDLAGAAGFEMLARFDQRGDGNPYLPIRTRWYDDVLAAAVDEGRRQVVMLAAGLDTRAYRLALPPQTVLLEVDQPRLLADKQMVLDAAGTRPRCDRRAVSADLGGDWTAPLEQAGYQGDDPAVFTAEGVLFYLTESAARTVLTTAAGAAAPGSRLAVDLVNGGFFRFRTPATTSKPSLPLAFRGGSAPIPPSSSSRTADGASTASMNQAVRTPATAGGPTHPPRRTSPTSRAASCSPPRVPIDDTGAQRWW